MAESGDAATKTYRGNCHCGAFVFEVEAPDITEVTSCNCSICTKKGYLWIYPKNPPKIIKGENALTGYSFGPKMISHQFCPTCGVAPIAWAEISPGVKLPALNVRTFQGMDLTKLQRKKIDGQAVNPDHQYKAPAFAGPEPSANVEGGKTYTGSCHCGAITCAVKVKTLDKAYPDRMIDCNCSFCRRAAYVWVYPDEEQIVVQGRDNLSYYTNPGGFFRKYFCKKCGVYIGKELDPLTDEQIAALPEETRRKRAIPFPPGVTLRMLNDFSLDSVAPTFLDGWNERGSPYVNP